LLSLLLLACIPVGYKHLQRTWDLQELQADVDWLTETYRALNPEKLAAAKPEWPKQMVQRYRQKMWVLHRQIAKEYKVSASSLKKPPSMQDDEGL